jgi:hypothetical protein
MVKGKYLMEGERKQRWEHLCEQAAKEQDPERLMVLIREINQLLEEKEARLQHKGAKGKESAA